LVKVHETTNFAPESRTMKLVGGQALAPLVSISTYLVLIAVLFAAKIIFARVGARAGAWGMPSVFLFVRVGVFDDATLRSIDGAFDTLCKELNDIAEAKTSFGHE
jgi:hypothetical protein